MDVIIDQDIPIGENSRLVKRLYKVKKDHGFPEGLKFAYQFLFFKGGWIEIARIDNYPHDKKRIGTHIHKIRSKEIVFKDMDFEECEDYIIKLGFDLIRCLK